MTTKSKIELFFELAGEIDKDGFSRKVYVAEFVGKYQSLVFGNGGDWCRSDGHLGKIYNIVRHKEKGRIVYVELHGFNKNPVNKSIPAWISKHIKKERCRVLHTGNPECDHKDGRYDDPKLDDPSLDMFQPLSKGANDAKRQHCKVCEETGQRFDASLLGYPVGQVKGNGTYRGTCVGCYWYDPFEFNKSMFFNK